MSGTPVIRAARERDLDELTDVWERAARSTHRFMDDDDFAFLRPRIRDLLLPSMDVWEAVDDEDAALGFIGARDSHVELLYIDPVAHGQGIGTTLLNHVGGGAGASSVQVYADNTTGLGFYRSRGFRETHRHPTDFAGRPFAIVHLDR